jgi:hypothetical protein
MWYNFLIQHVRSFCHSSIVLYFKKTLKYQLLNVCSSLEMWMFIMSKNRKNMVLLVILILYWRLPYKHYIVSQQYPCIDSSIGRVEDFLTKRLWFESRRRKFFPVFLLCFLFFYIQMFFYSIMRIFITLLENVNKSCTSASSLSLKNLYWDHIGSNSRRRTMIITAYGVWWTGLIALEALRILSEF